MDVTHALIGCHCRKFLRRVLPTWPIHNKKVAQSRYRDCECSLCSLVKFVLGAEHGEGICRRQVFLSVVVRVPEAVGLQLVQETGHLEFDNQLMSRGRLPIVDEVSTNHSSHLDGNLLRVIYR